MVHFSSVNVYGSVGRRKRDRWKTTLHRQPRMGKIWEQKTMQQQSHDFTRTHHKTYCTPSEAEPYDTLNNTRDSSSAYGVQEQRPASALHAQKDEYRF